MTLDGTPPPTEEELAEDESLRAKEAERRAKELEAEIARYRERFGDVTE